MPTINYTSDQIILEEGVYYFPPFLQDSKDELVTIAVWLTEAGTVSMQSSFDGIEWLDIPCSSFTCNTSAIQNYAECQVELLHRFKSDKEVVKAKIMI